MLRNSLALLVCAVALCTVPGVAQTTASSAHGEHWVGAWAAAPVGIPNENGLFAHDTTLRETVHLSLGGTTVRVVLTNEFGLHDLTIGGAAVATAATSPARPLTFNGQPGVTIPAGASALSDPIALAVAPLSDLNVLLFIPGQPVATITRHDDAQQTSLLADGNQLLQPTLSSPTKTTTWPFLKAVEVLAPAHARAVVTLGDSITDGWRSTEDANHRWPDELARRLQADPHTANIAVLNAGISANRLIHEGFGPSALARFDRDVLGQDGVRYLIVLEGINDIGHIPQGGPPFQPITLDDLKFALEQIVVRAHAHGILVFGATLTPFLGAGYASPAGEQMRLSENDFIRNSGLFDGVIDFDAVTRDPAKPGVFSPALDSDDHLHPNDAGYKAMGDAVDLKLFSK
jgi:lysophospholipase L1-like esterase